MPPGRSAPSGHRAPAGQPLQKQPAAGEQQGQPKRHPAAACGQTRAVARHRPEQGRSGSEKPRAVPQVREPPLPEQPEQPGQRAAQQALREQQGARQAQEPPEQQGEPWVQKPPEQLGRPPPTAAACGQTREACFRLPAQQPRHQADPHRPQPRARSPARPRLPSRPQARPQAPPRGPQAPRATGRPWDAPSS